MSAKQPRFWKIRDELQQKISAGEYPVGSLLPTEMQLCETYGVSRYTVRAALAELSRIGVIRRSTRVGSVVTSRLRRNSFSQQLATLSDLDRFANEHTREILETHTLVVDTTLASQIHCPPGERRIRLTNIRHGTRPDDAPLCLTRIYMDEKHRSILRTAKRSPGKLLSELLEEAQGIPIVRVSQSIEAWALPAEDAAILRAEPHSPALRILRHYCTEDGGMPLISDSFLPAGRYAFSLDLNRDK